jgi:allantoicase
LSPSAQLTPPSTITLPALPLTVEAFAPYGQVIQGFSFDSSAPKGTSVTIANQGTAFKFHRMANVSETYEKGALVRGGPYVAVTRSDSRLEVKYGAEVPVTVLER